MYAPVPSEIQPGARSGILGYAYQVSDSGDLALVQFVVADRKALAGILADRNPQVKVFQRGVHKQADMQAEFRRLKKDFDFSRFEVRLP